MMCPKVLELLPTLAEKMLGPRDVSDVTEHLNGCARCSRAWKRHQAVEHFFVVEQAPSRPPSYWENARRRILDQIVWTPADRRAQSLPQFRARFIAVGAAVAAALLLALVSLLRSTPAPTPPTPAVVHVPEKKISQPDIAPVPEPKKPDVVDKPEPKQPDVVDPPKKEPVVDKPEPRQPVVVDPPKKEPVVDKPEPRQPDPVVPPKKDPVTDVPKPEEPKPVPTQPERTPVAAVLLPGDNGYAARIAEEHIRTVLAKTDVESISAMLHAARARLDEIAFAVDANPGMIGELSDAYAALLGSGVSEVVTRKFDAPTKLSIQQEILAQHKLLSGIKGAETAISAAKAVAELRLYRPTFRSKGALGILGLCREMAEIGSAKDFNDRVNATNALLEHRVIELIRHLQAKQADAMGDAAADYEAVLLRGQVELLTRAYDKGTDITAQKRSLLRGLQGTIDSMSKFVKTAAANLKPRLQQAIDATKTAREAIARIPDGINPDVKPTKPTEPDPVSPTKPPVKDPGKVDPGFDPNDPNAPPKKDPPPEKGFDPKR